MVTPRPRDFAAPGVLVAPSVEAALAAARGDALRRGADAIMVIGGAEIYAQAMAVADRLEITHVHAQPGRATRSFRRSIPAVWREARAASAGRSRTRPAFDFVTYAAACGAVSRSERQLSGDRFNARAPRCRTVGNARCNRRTPPL